MLHSNYDYNKYWTIHFPLIMDKLVEVYHTVDISEADVKFFHNVDLDFVLEIIGNQYRKEGDASSSFSIAYEKIVEDANRCNKKASRYKYWISKKQIKSLRKAFKKIASKDFFVRIPFNTINILNSIYFLINNINIYEQEHIQNKANNRTVSVFLAKAYIDLFIREWVANPELRELDRARELYRSINDEEQISNQIMR